MINIIIWFAAFLCPNPNAGNQSNGSQSGITINSGTEGDTGGETGGTHLPPTPPPPPPPGGN